VRCPHCRNKLLQKSGTSTRLRIRGVVEFNEVGLGKAECYWCHQLVDLPVELKRAATDEEKFTIPVAPAKTPA